MLTFARRWRIGAIGQVYYHLLARDVGVRSVVQSLMLNVATDRWLLRGGVLLARPVAV